VYSDGVTPVGAGVAGVSDRDLRLARGRAGATALAARARDGAALLALIAGAVAETRRLANARRRAAVSALVYSDGALVGRDIDGVTDISLAYAGGVAGLTALVARARSRAELPVLIAGAACGRLELSDSGKYSDGSAVGWLSVEIVGDGALKSALAPPGLVALAASCRNQDELLAAIHRRCAVSRLTIVAQSATGQCSRGCGAFRQHATAAECTQWLRAVEAARKRGRGGR
jgi:hypothetical protein